MHIHDIINESFSDPLAWEWKNPNCATFTSPTGLPYHVYLHEMKPQEYFFGFDVAGRTDGLFTRENRALQILSTVIDIMGHFVKINPHTEKLFFYSRIEEKSRIGAYRNILRRFAQKHDFTFSEKNENIGIDTVKFTIKHN